MRSPNRDRPVVKLKGCAKAWQGGGAFWNESGSNSGMHGESRPGPSCGIMADEMRLALASVPQTS